MVSASSGLADEVGEWYRSPESSPTSVRPPHSRSGRRAGRDLREPCLEQQNDLTARGERGAMRHQLEARPNRGTVAEDHIERRDRPAVD